MSGLRSDCTVPGCEWHNVMREFPGEDERELHEHVWMAHGGYGD